MIEVLPSKLSHALGGSGAFQARLLGKAVPHLGGCGQCCKRLAHLRGGRSSICCTACWRHLPLPYPPILPSDPILASSQPSLCPPFIREDAVGTGGRKVLRCVLLLGHPPEGKHGPDVPFSERGHPCPLLCGGKTVGERLWLCWEGRVHPASPRGRYGSVPAGT